MTWTWADNQLRWLLQNELLQSYLVIAVHSDCGAFEDEVLVDVPGEGVIIVNHDKVGGIFERCDSGVLAGGMINWLKRRHLCLGASASII